MTPMEDLFDDDDRAHLDLDAPIFFGRFLVLNGLISEQDLETALAVQQDLNDCITCAALEQGLISLKDFIRCREYQRDKVVTFEEAAGLLGALSSEEIENLKGSMQRLNVRLGDILVQRGVLNANDLEKALQDYQRGSSIYSIEP